MDKLLTIQKRNKLNEVYAVDKKGNGGAHHAYVVFKQGVTTTDGAVGAVQFQDGARNVEGSTPGVLDTDLLEIVRHRLQCFQDGAFACEENAKALEHIEITLMYMNKRVEDRAERNVLGQHKK